MTEENPRRGWRKLTVALVALLGIFALAWIGKLDAIAAGAIGGVLALYNHANLQAKKAEK